MISGITVESCLYLKDILNGSIALAYLASDCLDPIPSPLSHVFQDDLQAQAAVMKKSCFDSVSMQCALKYMFRNLKIVVISQDKSYFKDWK